jgi:hypothetical protein
MSNTSKPSNENSKSGLFQMRSAMTTSNRNLPVISSCTSRRFKATFTIDPAMACDNAGSITLPSGEATKIRIPGSIGKIVPPEAKSGNFTPTFGNSGHRAMGLMRPALGCGHGAGRTDVWVETFGSA